MASAHTVAHQTYPHKTLQSRNEDIWEQIIEEDTRTWPRSERDKRLAPIYSIPIAVFDNHRSESNRAILTELRTIDGNILVTIEVGKGGDVDFNIVSSVFGKRGNSVVNWINKGYATYIDKEKALNYLHLSAPIAEATESQELAHAAKVIQKFDPPKNREGKSP